VARPYWLKLFGKNGDVTSDQIREAILNADLGARLVDSGNFPRSADRAGVLDSIRASIAADPKAHEQSDLHAAAQPGPAGIERPAIAFIASPGPANLLGDGDARLYTLQVGSVTEMSAIAKLVVADPPPERNPNEGFVGGWLETYLLFGIHSGSPMVAMTDSSIGEMDAWAARLAQRGQQVDTLALSGDFSAGFTLSSNPAGVGQVVLAEGHDYVLETDDDFVAAGRTLTVDGQALGMGNHVMFDGSAETDGRFAFRGGELDDYFFGGAGADSISGAGGADVLSGGGGGDTFVFACAGESRGADYDLLADFDPAADRIDLSGSVTGFAAAVASGSLSDASFDDDLGAALGGLGAGQAVWFAPDAGDHAGQIFLVVDGNGVAGYQAGEDYVFGIAGSPLADLTGHTGFFV
jgi:hypothetical protein